LAVIIPLKKGTLAMAEQGTEPIFRKKGKGLLTATVFGEAFKKCVFKLMKRNEISLPMNKETINKLLKQLTVHFHWKINKIYEANEQLRCFVQKCITLCDTATKMIKGTYRGPLPEYFRETFEEIEDEYWKMFFIQRIIVYHDHFSSCGSGEMNLNGV